MIEVLGFGIVSATLLVTFGKLITDGWFAYLMVALIQFQVLVFWSGSQRRTDKHRGQEVRVQRTDNSDRKGKKRSGARGRL